MQNYIKVAVLDNEIEALFLETVLKERQIPHSLRSYHDTAYDGLFQTQKGWGYVTTPEEYVREVEEIVRDIKAEAGRDRG